MSESRIDALARSLASGTSRRGALRALFGGAAGGALALAGATVGRDVAPVAAQAVCCGQGLTNCSGSCANTQTDVNNCGACAHACTAGASTGCVNGQCLTCSGGALLCDGKCVNGQTDPDNCGQCGATCGATQGCIKGVCVTCSTQIIGGGSAVAGLPLTACNGTCVKLWEDNQNCGACGKACPPGYYCGKSACVPSLCNTGAEILTMCLSSCVNLLTDHNNCGSCSNACDPEMLCLNGSCVFCAPGAQLCGGACVRTFGDPNNCGGCGAQCAAPNVCYGGACCPPSDALCWLA